MANNVATIRDSVTGAEAQVLVSLGFNCLSWRPVLDDGPREMLWSHPEFAGGHERPSASGIPLLFPFPGRIGQARFTYAGRDYSLEPGDATGNAIHGFVLNRPWRIVDQRPGRVVGEFQASVDDAAILSHWPSDFRIRVGYEVRGRELVSDVYYENTGDGPLPCGFGTHAYFRLPLAARAAAEETLLFAPVSKMWEMRDMLATGRLLSIPSETAVSGGPLAGRQFDTMFTGLQRDSDGFAHTWLREPVSGRTLTQRFGAAFTQCIVYTPPHREAICIEPYTCVPDAFRLAAAGHETGLQVLAPGESFKTTIVLSVG